jgi:tetratricopeptide (TPR) repeat protein
MDTAVVPRETVESSEPALEGRLEWSAFEIVRQIGHGGMATIHLARYRAPGATPREVALKLMHAHLCAETSLVRRFEHEVRAQVGLKHPNVVEMIGWGQDDQGRLFMAMELVDGPALRDLMAGGRRFPADVAAYVARGILRGLAAAHARGLVHRDIKPANVMLTSSGQVKVADFGISKTSEMTKLTSTGNVIGTPAYMSPEQALARDLDHRSDLFSAGVVLYEMLLGGNPFQTGNPATTLSRIVHHQPRPAFETLPQTPALLDELVDELLQKDPGCRVPDADAAIDLLERCVTEEDLLATTEVFTAFVRDPDVVTRQLGARRARRHFERGCRAYANGKGSGEAAVWELFLATLLDPADQQARTWLEQVSRERGFNLQDRKHPRIEELEAKLREKPDDMPVILQLAKLHKSLGNFLQVIYYWRRARALQPPDNYTRNQIETLISAQAANILDATGMFEVKDHVPVRLRPAGAGAPGQGIVAESWGDVVASAWRAPWAKAAAFVAAILVTVLGCGALFDSAVEASRPEEAPGGAMADPGAHAQVDLLEEASQLSAQGHHEAAEKRYRTFLEQHPSSGLASEARFRLGESLERQGRRDEAIEVHGENASMYLDEWALRSRENRGEMLALDGDVARARSEYEAVARGSDGEQKARATLALAKLAAQEGRAGLAGQEFEDAVASAAGTPVSEPARLAFADFLAQAGETQRAQVMYEDVRAHADHHGESFKQATEGLARIAGGAPAAPPPVNPPPVTEPALETPPPQDASSGEASTAGADAATTPPPPEAPATGLLAGLGGAPSPQPPPASQP